MARRCAPRVEWSARSCSGSTETGKENTNTQLRHSRVHPTMNRVTKFLPRLATFTGLLSLGIALASNVHSAVGPLTQNLLEVLPGKGLAQHDFFYAGEAKQERMFIVRHGQVVWSYTHDGRGEISDAVLLANGNILFAHQFGVTEIDADKKVI